MRGRFNAGYVGRLQNTTAGTTKGVYNMVEMQQYAGVSQWPRPPEDFFFNYVSALFHGNGGAPLTPSSTGTNTTNFNDDFSTNNFLLEVFGDVRGNKFNPFFGRYYSNYFDGNGDNLSIAGSSSFAITTSTTPFTVEAWVYPTVAGSCIFSDQYTGAGDSIPIVLSLSNGTTVDVNSGLIPAFGWYDSVNWTTAAMANVALATGTWSHVAAVFTGSTTRIYINGVDRTAASPTPATTWGMVGVNGNNWYVGRRWDTASNVYFTGYISNFRFVNGTAVYTSNFTPPTGPLTAIANTVLLTCSSNRLQDLSNNSFSITRDGDVVVSPFVPFSQNTITQSSFVDNELYKMTDGYYGAYFDGNGDSLSISSSSIIPSNQSTFTIEGWLYMTANPVSGGTNTVPAMFGDMQPAGGINYLSMGPVGAGPYYLGLYWFDSAGRTVRGNTTLSLNTWYHLAVSVSSNAIKLFVNGVEQTLTGTTTLTNRGSNSGTFALGNYSSNASAVTGFISNFRVVSGTAVYTGNFTPSTTPLTAITNTSLLTCQSATIIDNSTNNFTITRNGDANASLSHPFFGTTTTTGSQLQLRGSTYCDGTGDYLRTDLSSQFTIGTNDFTIDFWVLVLGASGTRRDFVDIIAGSGFNRILIYYSGTTLIYSAGDSVAATTRITGGAIPLGQWTHIALSRVSGSTRLFINGIQTGSTFADTLNWTSTMRTLVGFGQGGTTPHFGYISDVRVINGTGLYRASFIPPTVPSTALANTRLLTSQRYDPSYNSQFKDSSYQNNIITRNGNVTAGSFSPYETNNWSVYFDGSGDYLTVPDSTNWDFGTGDFTVELFLKYNVATGDQCWVAQYLSPTVGWSFRSGSVGQTQWAWGDTLIAGVTDVKQVNTWTHYAVCRQGTSLRLFKNGVQIGDTVTDTRDYTGSTAPVYIGTVTGSAWFTTGFISNVRILKGTALYTSNFTPPTGPLTAIANTVLLTCQNSRLIDNSPSNAIITRFGDSRVSKFGPFNNNYVYDLATFGGSAWFDGTGDYLTVSRLPASVLGSSNWTIECWFYATDTRTSVQIIGNRSSATGSTAYVPILIAFESSNIRFFSSTNGTSWNINNATTIGTVALRSWNHVAVVRNGANIDGYLNGTKVSLNTNMTGTYTATNLFYASTAESLPFFGFISDYRLVVGEALYTNNFTVPTSPLQVTPNTAFLLSMSDAGQYDSAMAGNWESMGNAQSTQSNISKFGQGSLYFDGTGDYLYSPYYPHMYLGTTFTIEMWVYHNSRGAATQSLYDQAVAVTTNFAFQALSITSAGVLQFQVRPTTGAGITTVTGGTVPLTTWTHIAVCSDNSTITLYINGSQSGSSTAVTLMAAALPIGVGIGGPGTGSGAATGASFNGYIDDVRVTRGIARYSGGSFNVPIAQFNDR